MSEESIAAIITEVGSTMKNKTGSWRTFKPVVDASKCTACNLCDMHCPDSAIKVGEDKKAHINYDYCKGCGICAEICPIKAITMERDEK